MAAVIDRVVMLARGEVGVTEATGRNDGARVEEYLGGESERGLSWCAAFVLWCYETDGYRWRDNRWLLRRVSTLYEVARRRGAVLTGADLPEAGDLVLWIGRNAHPSAGPSGHVAIVVGCRLGPDGPLELEIVAGNEDNGVVRRWISVHDPRITAFVRPSRGMIAEKADR